MMFVVRSAGERPPGRDIAVKAVRRTPEIVADGADKTDFFCAGEAAAIEALGAAGWTIVALHDGWYADDHGGGIGIWGQGKYWEIRDTPFTVKEACGPAATPEGNAASGETVNIRREIFGA